MISETHPGLTLPPPSLDAALLECALLLQEHGHVDWADDLRMAAGLPQLQDKRAAVHAMFVRDNSLDGVSLPESNEDYSHLRLKQLRNFIAEAARR
ncbi:MAG: hypothetical protein GY898_33520 [Proteobacteria bacterium]|nr:hypothetical protein [Pseudomonadota bacterium]